MQLATLVAASEATASTRKRTEKIGSLAGVFRDVDVTEAAIAVGFLRGRPRQGKIGTGWAALRDLDVRPAGEPALTLVEADSTLTALDEMSGQGVEARRRETLEELFARATEAEQLFLRRLLVGELRQGALEGVVTDAVAKGAGVPPALVRRALMLTGDLGETAEIALREGEAGLSSVALRVLRPLKPMLAASAETVEAAIEELGEAFVEWKLDGARIQVHRRADETRVYTRNLNDVTARLPEVVAAARALPAHAVVLDGEVMTLGVGERPVPFQDSMSRFGRDDHGEAGMTAFYFDCLHLDGEDLLDEPFALRRAKLEQTVGEAATPGRTVSGAAAARAFFDEALDAGHEGVMVKDLEAPYQAGRRGKAWRKVKPVVTVDLVDVQGNDRRAARLADRAAPRETSRDGITVRVRPELVVEIALDSVQRSSRYPGGVALRFARVKRYRADKEPGEATTIDELRSLLGEVAG